MIHLRTHTPVRGFALLMAAVLLCVLATIIAITVIFTGLDAARTSGTLQDYYAAQAANAGCAELALQKLAVSSAYTGTNTATLGSGTCSYTIAASGASDVVTVSGTVNTDTVRSQLIITVATLTVTSWQLVGT